MSLASLYARIPAVDCIPGCTDCCGVIPLPLVEERRNFGMANFVDRQAGEWATKKARCPNITPAKDGCRIHDRRPFMCRLFGTIAQGPEVDARSQRMICPHGRTPKEPLTVAQLNTLTLEYFEMVRQERA